MKKLLIVIFLLLVGSAVGGWYWYGADRQPSTFRTVQVERGDVRLTVGATGTIEPEEVVDVGAQVAGQIVSFGDDPRGNGKLIDYATPVEKGTVLARIDESTYRTQVDRAKAQVEQAKAEVESAQAQVASAEANVQKAEADMGQMQAKLYQADRDYARVTRLLPTKAVADVDYDVSEAAFRTAKATLSVGEAAIAQTKASVKDAQANVAKMQAMLHDAQANLRNTEINLGYCTIKSPVKGVIVDRRVNTGQTVVSSLNAPSLFLIAKDLKRLQVWTSVNEADVGNIHSGQNVTFTVDTFPGRVFQGVVAPDQPRLNASMTQNVVTYTVVVTTDNSDGKLLPYMTANLQFEVNKRADVLRVANSALRWKPSPEQIAPDARDEYLSAQSRKTPAGTAERDASDRGVLWVEEDGFVRPVAVRTGLNDGVTTEIVSGDIQPGAAVVIGEERAGGSGGGNNPFAPKIFRGKKA